MELREIRNTEPRTRENNSNFSLYIIIFQLMPLIEGLLIIVRIVTQKAVMATVAEKDNYSSTQSYFD